MKIVYCEPSKKAEVIEIHGNLESMQKCVGGYIQAVFPWEDPVALICNEDGRAMGLAPNRALTDGSGNVTDVIVGAFFIVGLGEEDFVSLSDAQAQKYLSMFEYPEYFVICGDELHIY